MTVTYLPNTHDVHDLAVKQNFEYLESHGLFTDDNLASIVNKTAAIDNLGALDAAENLGDLISAATARTNLGLPDGSGNAPFLQLLSSQKLRLAYGNATTPAPSPASMESPLQMVNHGLGAVPQIVLTQNTGGAYGNVLSQRWDTSVNSTTQFGVRTESNAAFSFAVGFSWIALG